MNFDGFLNFDGLTLLTALVLYSQSDYLNHSNKDSGDDVLKTCKAINIHSSQRYLQTV